VDGSYNIRTQEFGSGIVLLENGKELLSHSEAGQDLSMASMRNVAGEIKGSQWAIEYAIANGYQEIQLHFDYEGIEKWALGTWKANKEGTIAYQNFYNSIKDRIKVYFVKVKAHSGDIYNDKADILAKAACGQ
jgi:ribonuclease HI